MKALTLTTIVVSFTACATIPQQEAVSECGGFENTQQQQALTADGASGYCDAEVLSWEYSAGKLSINNTRVLLNCCGEHSIGIDEIDDGEYLVTEVDQPDGIGGRCGCMCVFDFELEANELPERTIKLVLERDVTDSENGIQTVWEGELDLSQGSGDIVVDETDVEGWCEE